MKKTLLAVSIGLPFASLVHAQTPTSTSVTLYGIADANFRLDHTTIGTLKSVGSGGESGARWGIRGSEDLGGGLKAVFVFEQGIDLSDNSVAQGDVTRTTPTSPVSSTGGRLFSRTATVGLNSATLGELRVGRDYTPFYVTWVSIDPFSVGLVGGGLNYSVGNISRYDNAIYYNSSKIYGFQLSGAYRLGESTTNTVAAGAVKNGGNAGSLSFTYAQGPILAGYAYLNTKNAINNNTTRAQFVGGIYDFNVVRLHALVFRDKNDANTVNRQAYAVGLTIPIAAWTVLGSVARIDNRVNNGAANNNPSNDDSMFYGVGVTYAFSKRTDVYTSGARRSNRGNSIGTIQDATTSGLFTTVGATPGSPGNVTPGFDPWSFQVGMRHRF